MRRYSRYIYLVQIFAVLFCLFPQFVSAQPTDPVLFDTDTPIDGGIGILVAAGVAYGIKKYRDERKRQRAS